MSNGNVIYVAPSNSTKKSIADYVCDGTNDANQINAAIAEAKDGTEIVLLDGKFNIRETINVNKKGLVIRGMGKHVTVVEQVALTGSKSAIIFDISNCGVRLQDMMIVDVDVNYPNFIIRTKNSQDECIFKRLFFILKAQKTNINAYVDIEGIGVRFIDCRVYNYNNVPAKKTINILGSNAIIAGMLNTGAGPIRINFSDSSYSLFGNDDTEIYVNGAKK